jgi:hypothetical protein
VAPAEPAARGGRAGACSRAHGDRGAPQAGPWPAERFEREADALVGRVVERGCYDAFAELAEPLPVKVLADAVGLPAADPSFKPARGSTSTGPRPSRRSAQSTMNDQARS